PPGGNTPAQYVPRALLTAVRVDCNASESIVTLTAPSALPFEVMRPTMALDIDCAAAGNATSSVIPSERSESREPHRMSQGIPRLASLARDDTIARTHITLCK